MPVSRTKFRNPPLEELVLGSYFPPIQALRAQHVGLFWSSLITEFPICSQHPPIKEIVQFDDEVFPMSQFWLVSRAEDSLIQIQKNAFIANWRRRPDGPDYPHYESVKRFFDSNLSRFTSFLSDQLSYRIEQVISLEMTYTNFIPLPSSLPNGDYSSLIAGLSILPGLGTARKEDCVCNRLQK